MLVSRPLAFRNHLMNKRVGAALERRERWHFHLFWGPGGGARGFGCGSARIGNVVAIFRCCHTVAADGAARQAVGKLVAFLPVIDSWLNTTRQMKWNQMLAPRRMPDEDAHAPNEFFRLSSFESG